MSDTIYQMMTEKICTLLERGLVPWRQPWRIDPTDELPLNITGRPYRGINTLVLSIERLTKGYGTNVWFTLKQANEHHGRIRTGAKSTPIIFWKSLEREGPVATEREDCGHDVPSGRVWLLRYYRVFNLDQTEGVRLPARLQPRPTVPVPPIAACERIVEHMPRPPPIAEGGTGAGYLSLEDRVVMPARTAFQCSDDWYATLFHELAHSTGHPTRLNRYAIAAYQAHTFGSEIYGKEELVAELGSAMVCAAAAISPAVVENQAAYLQHWLGVLRADTRLLIHAAGQAQKAADYILGTEAS